MLPRKAFPRPVVVAVTRAIACALSLLLFAAGCATNPATGRPQLSFYGEESELGMGRDADAELVAAVGLYEQGDWAEYVEEVGMRLASTSERPHLPWSFKVLDDPSVNAFALPGGYVYVTRGILAELGSEAELAAVLGHEIGHVTAKHTLHRQSQQVLATAGVVTAAVVLDPEHADDWAELGMLGVGLAFLKYSRDDERQADDLGLRYVMRAGYDPREMPGVFEMLDQLAQVDGGTPTWLSTHPNPGKRLLRISKEVSAVQARGEMPTRVEREAYLRRLDGMPYGPDPRRAVVSDEQQVASLLGEGEDRPIPSSYRLEVVPLDEELPLATFAERYPSAVGLAELALLNRVKPDGTLAADTLVKRVVADEPPVVEQRYEKLRH